MSVTVKDTLVAALAALKIEKQRIEAAIADLERHIATDDSWLKMELSTVSSKLESWFSGLFHKDPLVPIPPTPTTTPVVTASAPTVDAQVPAEQAHPNKFTFQQNDLPAKDQ